MSSAKFNVQEFSSLICPDSKHTAQQQKTFRIRICESNLSPYPSLYFFDLCVILSTCSSLRNRNAAMGFSTRYRAAPFSEKSRIHEVASFSGTHASRFLQGLICLGPKMKVSCTQICVVLHLLSSESDSFFRLTSTCLVVSFVVCVRVASKFIDDHWCLSQIRFNVQIMSSLICTNPQQPVQQQKTFHV